MLLQRLVEFSRRILLPPSLYMYGCPEWVIALDSEGKPENMIRIPERMPIEDNRISSVPFLGNLRTSNVRPLLFFDHGGYVLGIPSKPKQEARAREQHAAFRALVQVAAEAIPRPEVQAVKLFYERWFDRLEAPKDYKPNQTIVFRVGEHWLIDLPEVQEFWAKYAREQYEIVGERATCMVCSQLGEIVRRHFIPVKDIPGGEGSGMAFISANAEAFCSYGFREDFNVPICLDCSERALKALYYLMHWKQNHYRMRLGEKNGLVYCFWTRTESEFNPIRFMDDPDPNAVKALLESVKKGKPSAPLNEPDFYAVALSPNSARVVVRRYLELTVPEVQHNLAQWFEWQRLMRDPVNGDMPLGVFRLAVSLYREAKDMPPHVPETLIRSAFTGAPLPNSLLQVAVQRNRAEQGVRYERAKLIKAVLASQDTQLKEALTMLNRELNDPAYKCGRLLAVIERIQGAALNNPNATLTDKYYGSASTAPASVFGVLLRMTQPHLSKLRKQREGVAIWLERELHNAMPDRFPATLSLKEQGLFALGYYHQRSEFFKPKSDATEEGNDDENA